jgi:inosose dehydratase
VHLAFHHHMGTAIQAEDEIDRLMAETGPEVGLLLDTGHATYAGADPLALAKRHAKRIVHVHCKDVRRPVLDQALAKRQSFLDAVVDGVFTVPGDGAIAYKPILSHLAGQGYAGWLVVEAEQDPAKAHPLTYATMGFRNLRNLAQGSGFTVATG